jgi:topoisomerase-4 subunit A
MGVHINSIINIDSDEKIINAFDYTDKNEDSRILVIATKEGSIKRTKVSDLGISKLTKISTVMGLDENDSLVSCLVTEDNEQ